LSDNGDSAKITSTIFVREMVACDIHKPLDLLQQREWNDPDLQDDIDVLCEAVQAQTRELTQWKVYQAEVESGVLRWSSRLHCSKFFRENARSMEGPRGDFEPLQRLVQILYRHTQNGRLSSVSGSKTMYVGLKEVVVPGKNGSRYDNKEFSWDQDDINDDEVCETLAVALYDIGEFARHYPNGRGVIAAAGRLQWAQTDPRQESVLGKTKSLVFQYMHHPREEVQEQALSCISKLLVKNWNVS
jgi:V-type H+-transporting ATPase subunit H